MVRISPGMTDLMGLVKDGLFEHHGNPVARFCFETVEVVRSKMNPDLIRPVKPERDSSGARIDAVPAAAMAVSAWKRDPLPEQTETPRRRIVVSSR